VERLGAGLKSDVLKVGHHGSRSSSTAALLQVVAPRLSVASAGRANRFGHPHAEVVERLEAPGRTLLRTDQVGGVRLWSDGKRLRVDAWDPGVKLEF
jgi:competence protein ComEC